MPIFYNWVPGFGLLKVRSFTDKLEWAVPDKNKNAPYHRWRRGPNILGVFSFFDNMKATRPCRISRTYNVLFFCFGERANGRKRGLYECWDTHTSFSVSPTKQELFSKCRIWCLLLNTVLWYIRAKRTSATVQRFISNIYAWLMPRVLLPLYKHYISKLPCSVVEVMIKWPWIVNQSYTEQLYNADTPLNNGALHVWGWDLL